MMRNVLEVSGVGWPKPVEAGVVLGADQQSTTEIGFLAPGRHGRALR